MQQAKIPGLSLRAMRAAAPFQRRARQRGTFIRFQEFSPRATIMQVSCAVQRAQIAFELDRWITRARLIADLIVAQLSRRFALGLYSRPACETCCVRVFAHFDGKHTGISGEAELGLLMFQCSVWKVGFLIFFYIHLNQFIWQRKILMWEKFPSLLVFGDISGNYRPFFQKEDSITRILWFGLNDVQARTDYSM